ncbi:sensor histidine kinase [Tepidicaulis sp. LMO-SS28]|uniref:sensor histidine kinase n=1 Tax=Tepidicaulis sp. LMO-SS28 TaxID=3447455 RepID=UPI003EE38BC4
MSMESGQSMAAHPIARDLALPIAPVDPGMRCADVFDLLMDNPDATHIPVIERKRIVGLVSRQRFILSYAALYGRELYGRRPISSLMDQNPLVVEGDLECEEVNRCLLARGTENSDLQGFIIAEKGDYLGIATITGLMSVIASIMTHRAEELELARRRAEAASESKTQFLASMSHELRAPLNAVIGFADLIRKETFGAIAPSKYLEYVSDIHASGSHLLSMINDILDMAKIESGRFGLQEEIFDPVIAAQDILRMLTPEIEKRDLTLDICGTPDSDLPLLHADERYMRQILLNLLSNAVKFTPPGGLVRLCSLVHDDGALSIIVQDNGIGIPAEMIEKVFEPFEQVECSFTRRNPGTGLGLPLARAMVEAHGGTLSLESEEGRGTKVSVQLPAARVIRRGEVAAAPLGAPWPDMLTA